MNNDIIIQTMTESFETIKDFWETKSESIIRCIVETEQYDGSLSMDMWGYILQKNEKLIKDKHWNIQFIDNVILCFNDKYEVVRRYDSLCRTIINHIAPHMVKNENLIKLIYGKLYNAGYSGFDYGYIGNPSESIPACTACMLLQDSPEIIPVLFKALVSNKNMEDIRIGELFIKANFYLDGILNKWSLGNYSVSEQVKESLLSCLDLIEDKEDRAEIALSLMAR